MHYSFASHVSVSTRFSSIFCHWFFVESWEVPSIDLAFL